jgi:hypothetical protein
MVEKSGSRRDAFLVWAIGCCLFANTVAFFGIGYFDQSILAWYGLLAMISATATFGATRQRIPFQFDAATTSESTPEEPVERLQTFASLMR